MFPSVSAFLNCFWNASSDVQLIVRQIYGQLWNLTLQDVGVLYSVTSNVILVAGSF